MGSTQWGMCACRWKTTIRETERLRVPARLEDAGRDAFLAVAALNNQVGIRRDGHCAGPGQALPVSLPGPEAVGRVSGRTRPFSAGR